jgi:hypothetical protein
LRYITDNATSLQDLLDRTVAWVTDESIHGDDTWELIRNEPWPRGTIFKAKGANGIGSCYIGIMLVTHSVGSSYRNWLFQTKNIAKHLIRSTRCLDLKDVSFMHTNNSNYFITMSDPAHMKGATGYTISGDIVNANSVALVFGVFKQHDPGLDWNEQPGGLELDDLAQYPIYYTTNYVSGGSSQPIPLAKPPIYPGVGYPGIGMSSNEPSEGYFKYWLSKDSCRLTIVINNGGQWDMGHAGMLKAFSAKMQYAFPAVVAGSCTGLRTVATYSYSTGTTMGTKIDYRYSNNSLSRSMPIAPCTNAGARTPENSQVAACLPDGTWKFFSNWVQQLQQQSYYSTVYFTVPRPTRKASTGYVIKPTNTELGGVHSVLGNEDQITIEPLDLWHESLITTDMLGSLWNMYWPGSDSRFGEIVVSGKKCLLLPNCWEGRPWTLRNYTGEIISEEALMSNFIENNSYSKQFKMLIRLED